ncbi:MAG: fructose-6-phosphate aldolase [Candidatus Hatepunaea meridiana]|nr:fructose-6-phosphate aldolase [Candidatus Hatepunaea meridiana]
MKFFIDTANIEAIKEAAAFGILDGVTTNPSLVAKEGGDFIEMLHEICEIVDGPISAEVTATEHKAMVEEAKPLAALHKNIVIKIPMTRDGLKACVELAKAGIKVNMTLIFSAAQALLCAKAGAAYVSPFIGRLDDISAYGMDLVEDIVEIFSNYGYPTEVLVASIRHPIHVIEAAKIGADVVTIPPKVIDQLFKHPLTDIGLKKFLDDWEKVKK